MLKARHFVLFTDHKLITHAADMRQMLSVVISIIWTL
jgi:hypothetical protein